MHGLAACIDLEHKSAQNTNTSPRGYKAPTLAVCYKHTTYYQEGFNLLGTLKPPWYYLSRGRGGGEAG